MLSTRLGPLDVLATLHDGCGCDDLVSHAEVIVVGDVDVRVLDLTTLIEVKLAAGRAHIKSAARADAPSDGPALGWGRHWGGAGTGAEPRPPKPKVRDWSSSRSAAKRRAWGYARHARR